MAAFFDRALGAVLDINQSPDQLAGAVRGSESPMDYFGRFRTDNQVSRYIQTRGMHVTVLDDHDMSCRPRKARFAAHNSTPHRHWQSAHAVAVQLTVPGIPCIYPLPRVAPCPCWLASRWRLKWIRGAWSTCPHGRQWCCAAPERGGGVPNQN